MVTPSDSTATQTPHPGKWILGVKIITRALLLFILVNFAVIFIPLEKLGKVSAYNLLFPGRERLPFGENMRQAYNLSVDNLDAMFASLALDHAAQAENEFRVLLIGDSSVWGTLLQPDETLAGQINRQELLTCDGQKIRAYNLGYPTLSLVKDLLILQRGMNHDPDLVVWLVTLESFPTKNQASSPVIKKYYEQAHQLLEELGSDQTLAPSKVPDGKLLQNTLIARRRELADLARLQLLGVMWAATGIDQLYLENYKPAQVDLPADESYLGLRPGDDLHAQLAWELLAAGHRLVGDVPLLLVNEPILVSPGENADKRYNFFYPRWAYDAYLQQLAMLTFSNGWQYLDAWDLVPYQQFTNSAIHLTPQGEALLTHEVGQAIQGLHCP